MLRTSALALACFLASSAAYTAVPDTLQTTATQRAVAPDPDPATETCVSIATGTPDNWCVINCAVNNCPPTVCECSSSSALAASPAPLPLIKEAAQQAREVAGSKQADDESIQDDGSVRQPHTWEWRHRNEPCKGKACSALAASPAPLPTIKETAQQAAGSKQADDESIQDDGSVRQPHTWEWRHRNEPCKGKACSALAASPAPLPIIKETAQQAQEAAGSKQADDESIQDDGSVRQPHTWEWRHRNEPCKGKACDDSGTQSTH